jgi:hypothetical protein
VNKRDFRLTAPLLLSCYLLDLGKTHRTDDIDCVILSLLGSQRMQDTDKFFIQNNDGLFLLEWIPTSPREMLMQRLNASFFATIGINATSDRIFSHFSTSFLFRNR